MELSGMESMLALALCILTQDVTVTARETPMRIAIGSGVIFEREGNHYLVATAAHVVKSKTEIKVKCSQGNYDARLQSLADGIYDDIAVLRIKSRSQLKIAPLATEQLKKKTSVTLNGSAAVLESVGGMPCMVLSRPCRNGESGSAVYQDGKVVGVLSSSLGIGGTMCWFTSASRIRLMIREAK